MMPRVLLLRNRDQQTPPTSLQIIRDWFAQAKSPRVDPFRRILNGRHRLWNCWQADPDLKLPVSSLILEALADYEDDSHLNLIYEDANAVFNTLTRSVMNNSPNYYWKLADIARKTR